MTAHPPVDIDQLAADLGVPAPVVAAAHRHVSSGAALLVVSGELASGKDTVAPAVLEMLGTTTGRTCSTRCRCSRSWT